MGRKLYVGNLSYETEDGELQVLFSQVGQVESVSLMRDHMTGRARGFAFVEMTTEEGARKAISDLHNTSLGGRTLIVNEARPKPEYAGAGGSSRQRHEPRW